jgi:hypothetical protein
MMVLANDLLMLLLCAVIGGVCVALVALAIDARPRR